MIVSFYDYQASINCPKIITYVILFLTTYVRNNMQIVNNGKTRWSEVDFWYSYDT